MKDRLAMYGGDYYGLLDKGFDEDFARDVYAWERCLRIYRAVQAGATRRGIAEKLGVSANRISQIVQKGERIVAHQAKYSTGGPLGKYLDPLAASEPLTPEETTRRALEYKPKRDRYWTSNDITLETRQKREDAAKAHWESLNGTLPHFGIGAMK